MDILEDGTLELMYVHDGYGDMPEQVRMLFRDIFTEDFPDDGFSKAGYYENAFEEDEEYDFEDEEPEAYTEE